MNAAKVPGTTALNLSNSPGYRTTPFRVVVKGKRFGVNYTTLNIPQITLPADGFMVALESVFLESGAKFVTVDGNETPPHRMKTEGHVTVRVRDLVHNDFKAGGTELEESKMHVIGTFEFLRDGQSQEVTLPSELQGETAWVYQGFIEQHVSMDHVGHVLRHSDLNFTFSWNYDDSQKDSNWTIDEASFNPDVELTFLFYPNPYFRQRY